MRFARPPFDRSAVLSARAHGLGDARAFSHAREYTAREEVDELVEVDVAIAVLVAEGE